MQIADMNKQTSVRQRRAKLIGFGVILGIVVLAGLWFGIRHSSSPKTSSPATSSSMSGMMMAPASAAPNDATGPAGEVQVDLAPDDLKKAQIRTAKVGKGVTATKLRVPGIVKPDEYRQVHVTSLVSGIVRQVPVVLGDHVRRGQPLAVIFSSELAEAETQYLSTLAELEAEHKKLVRTQNLLQLGAASKQEEEEVAATHAAHEAHVRAALERIKLLGASSPQVAVLKQAEQIDPNFMVPAPINGVVLSRTANLGLVVNPAQELFTVTDLSTVWVMASLNEKEYRLSFQNKAPISDHLVVWLQSSQDRVIATCPHRSTV
jgi:multidrug efflux pump subunit AcrA (membrane-fusion protein)